MEFSTCVMGLELTATSVLIKVVFNSSSARLDCPNTFRRQRFTVPIILSLYAPHQAARGAINFRTMPLWARIDGS